MPRRADPPTLASATETAIERHQFTMARRSSETLAKEYVAAHAPDYLEDLETAIREHG